MFQRGQNILMESHFQLPPLFNISPSSILVDQLDNQEQGKTFSWYGNNVRHRIYSSCHREQLRSMGLRAWNTPSPPSIASLIMNQWIFIFYQNRTWTIMKFLEIGEIWIVFSQPFINFLEYQDVLKCVVVNNFWRVEKGVEDFTLRVKVSYKFSDDLFLLFNEPTALWTSQNQGWDDFFLVRHEMFLDDVDGDLGWNLRLRLCSPVLIPSCIAVTLPPRKMSWILQNLSSGRTSLSVDKSASRLLLVPTPPPGSIAPSVNVVSSSPHPKLLSIVCSASKATTC